MSGEGRGYAQVWLSIWGDDSFRDLTVTAQHLYFVLLTDPGLTYAGTGDWHPGRIAGRASGWTAAQVEAAAAELVRALYIVVDDDTGEFLIRSFIRHDTLMKQRNLGVAMAKARAAIASRGIRGVIVHELQRLHDEQPDLAAFKADQVRDAMDNPAIDPASYPCGDPTSDPTVRGQFNPAGDPTVRGQSWGHPPPQGSPQPNNSNYNLNLSTATSTKGGEVVREVTGGERDSEPPSLIPDEWLGNPRLARCAAHAGIDDPPPCVGCRDARRAAEEAGHARAREQMARAAAVKAERDACELCDPAGFILDVDEAIRCTHDPDRNGEAVLAADTARREREAEEQRARDAAKAAAEARARRKQAPHPEPQEVTRGPF